MVELSLLRKNKINLSDYPYKQDIENRLIMADFSARDLDVLQEILFSAIKISIRKLAKNIDIEEEDLKPILEKLGRTGLFVFDGDQIVVDKEMRKYFESQAEKFDPEFKPGMDFLRHLLQKVPIHVLPQWYSIPRTSNNIFDSLVEKFLLTPQIFQRYLMELNFNDPVLSGMVSDVYDAPACKIRSENLIQKYGMTREQFEENLLHLEFNFVCCLGYEKVGEEWKEIVTPFQEWREYLNFQKDTETTSISTPDMVVRKSSSDFSFIQDLSLILNMTKKQPIALVSENGRWVLNEEVFKTICQKMEGSKKPEYIESLIAKMRHLRLADVVDGRLFALEGANDWLDMRQDHRAMFLYRHPLNRLFSDHISPELCTDRNLREAEKSIVRVLNSGWVYFDEFVRGVIVPLGESSIVMLKKQGKQWRYTLPTYTEEELALIRATVLEWLFEIGVTAVGTHQGKDCFCVTPFGQSLFGR